MKSDSDKTLIGVLSKKDLTKSGGTVKEAMSTPPIAARADNKVADAACLMLKHKVVLLTSSSSHTSSERLLSCVTCEELDIEIGCLGASTICNTCSRTGICRASEERSKARMPSLLLRVMN